MAAEVLNKKELLEWLNTTLDLNITKVEETASGAIACQLLDVLYPNRVPMSKVHWGAEEPHEFVGNYKLLVSMLAELRIDKSLDVNKMIHCRPKELLELIGWFKSYYASIGGARAEDYDSLAQRAKGKGRLTN
jgi:RP/EB family microtubule-associated protein